MPFTCQRLEIPDILLISTARFQDARGYFEETYKATEFRRLGIDGCFVQDNHSHSIHGVIRGLHYQKQPAAQGKLVRVLQGELFDVAVDIRKGSPTFGKWISVTLTGDDSEMLYIPPGFAHGFCVLSDTVDFMYKCTAEYAFDLDRGIRWDDPEIGIAWPVPDPVLSEKDAKLPLLRDAEEIGINYSG
ncbi:MAG TPA: dTDP-4-dehydrorhamnose 3,5-epimerase [bacterium]|nr:dTDP-4-dehydrorhamnose 3,5-epimerase [bacterium]